MTTVVEAADDTDCDDGRHRPQYTLRMDARQQISRTRETASSSRLVDRIVRSAATLVRERGVHGVGLRRSLPMPRPSGVPPALLPGGKTQLITEALGPGAAPRRLTTPTQGAQGHHAGRRDRAIFAPCGRSVLEKSFTMGCAWPRPSSTPAGEDGYGRRSRPPRSMAGLRAHRPGQIRRNQSTAQNDASVLLAALEGALILSRANRSTQPLDTVQRFFTTSLTQVAANPADPRP